MNISFRRAAKIYLKTVLNSCDVLVLESVTVFGDIFVKPILGSGPLCNIRNVNEFVAETRSFSFERIQGLQAGADPAL